MMGYVVLLARCLVGGVLLFAALIKLRDLQGFGNSIGELGLVTGPARYRVAAGVVALEFAVAALIAFPWTAIWGLGAATVLLTVFSGIAFRAARRSSRVPCRCFGSSRTPLGVPQGARNAMLALISAIGTVVLGVGYEAITLHPAGILMIVGVGLVGLALNVFFDDIVELFKPVDLSPTVYRKGSGPDD